MNNRSVQLWHLAAFRKFLPALLLASMLFPLLNEASAQSSGAASGPSVRPLIHPPLLEQGDTIMFIAPAGELDHTRMMRAKSRLEKCGYRVKMREDLFAVDGYLGAATNVGPKN